LTSGDFVEIEKLSEMARRLRAKLENCYVEIKQYTVTVAAEEEKNPIQKANRMKY